MLVRVAVGLLTAWILSLFNFDGLVLSAIQPFTSIKLTVDMYYVAFALLGVFFVRTSDLNTNKKAAAKKED